MPFNKEAREGKQGSHHYYLTTMSWGELQQMAIFAEDLKDLDEDEQMQRGLAKKRITAMVDYLIEAPDHFFSALTLIILPRGADRPAVAGETGQEDWDYMFVKGTQSVPGTLRSGVLHISGEAQVFPADGQHRLRAGIDAIKQNAKLAKEEVPVVLIPFKDPDQVRQLFADLNLNAKPVSKTIGYAFESRDPLTQLAKRLGHEVPLFEGRVNRVTNSLSATSKNVITLNTLVECTKLLVSALAEHEEVDEGEFLKSKDCAELVKNAMEGIIAPFEEHWNSVIDGVSPDPDENSNPAGYLRDHFVFPHGLGWQALSTAAAELIREHGDSWFDIFREAAQSICWERTDQDTWEGRAVVYDEEGNRLNNSGRSIQATAELVLSAAKDSQPKKVKKVKVLKPK
jgi:DGQHR domain-containing protein